ncbi:MAG TPA: pyrroline-5-carboxylate reductase [Nevskia sp.]|nr:pyrroline-5-carboxylate reductase [Nevskia sp.]
MHELIAFVGGGNMAASLIGGLLAAGHPAARLRASTRSAESAERLRRRFGIEVLTDNAATVRGAGVVVLAVKPQLMAEALHGLRPEPGATIVSVAAGVRIATLAQWLGTMAIVRTMPNTPALFGAGISGMYADPALPTAARRQAEYVLGCAGATCWVGREELIDAVTALSGCGPAYYFHLTEVLREAGAALGLDPAVAAQLALSTFIGAARMAKETGEDVAALRAQVTSKGGSTEAALAHLEQAGLGRIFREALAAADSRARLRGEELARQAAATP